MPTPSPDTRKLVDTTARFVAAMREPLQELPAAVSGRLADLVAAIEEIEAVLQPSGAAAPEVHFAVEHIKDIAMALRQREVEATLCDTLEAALRAVGDAIVRNDAAAARAQSAVALLRDLARRGSDLIALIAAVQTPAVEPREQGAITEAARQESDRFDDTSHRSVTDWVKPRARLCPMTIMRHRCFNNCLCRCPITRHLPEAGSSGEFVRTGGRECRTNRRRTKYRDSERAILHRGDGAPASVASSCKRSDASRGGGFAATPFVDAGAAPPSDSYAPRPTTYSRL